MLNRWLRTTTRVISFITAGLIISACGGGGGSGGGGFLGNEGADQLDAVIAMTATNAAGDTDNQLSRSNPLTIEVTLQRANGDPIASAVVELGATVGTVSPDNSSALTDANGVAVFEVTYDGTEGAGTLTATYTEAAQSVDVSLSIQALAGAPAYLLDLATTDPSGNATQRFSSADPLTVTITLYSVEGVIKTPVANEIIALESSIGTVDPSNGSALTDDSGRATFLIQAQADPGAGTITATYSPPIDAAGTADEIFSRSQNVEAETATPIVGSFNLDLELLNGGGNLTTELNAEAPVTARVTLTTTSDTAAVESRIINLSSDIATVDPANGSTLTNSAGVAEFTLTAAGTLGAGTVIASFANEDVSLIETAVLEAVSAESTTGLTLVILDSDGDAKNILKKDSPLTVRVSIVDLEGAIKDVDDEIINLASSLGTVAPANGSSLTENGVAEFTLEFNGTVGAGTVTATYATAQGDLQLTENLEAQTDGNSLYVLSMSRSAGSLTPSNPITVTVNLRSGSASGPTVAGELISLTSQISNLFPSNGSVVTDASGNATFTLQYNGVNGAGTITASYTSQEGNSFSNSLNVTASEGTPQYTVDIQQASGTQFDEAGVAITAKVTGSSGTVGNLVVALASTVGVIEPNNGLDLTNGSGIAAFTLLGDGTTGAGTVTASLTDSDGNTYTDSISVYMFSSGPIVAPPSKMVFVSASPETVALKGSGGGTGLSEQALVTFKVTDSTGAAVPGQTVSFTLSTDLGGVALDAASATTDAAGNAVAVVNSGALPTPVRVTATLGDLIVLSDTLNVSSGLPVASRFSIYVAAQTSPCTSTPTNPGDCTTLQISGFDRFGNPVVDGTVVNVVTNCGGVGQDGATSTGSCVFGTDSFGRCDVTWVAPEGWITSTTGSPTPDPSPTPDTSGKCGTGVPSRVLAYTLGEEDFSDSDGDAYFSQGNTNTEEAEPYLDKNGDRDFDSGEFFVDWNKNGQYDQPNTSVTPLPSGQAPANALYNGTACVEGKGATPPAISTPPAETDDCTSQLIYVWDDVLVDP
jgi:hypothetical protein